MEKMRNILYICIMLLGIMCFVGCNDCHGNKKLLAQTDSLLQSRPDSALKLLNSIEKGCRVFRSGVDAVRLELCAGPLPYGYVIGGRFAAS